MKPRPCLFGLPGLVAFAICLLATAWVPVTGQSPGLLSPGARFAGGTASAHSPVVSSNGQWILFVSAAPNLVANDRNEAADVFLRDRMAGTTTALSIGRSGTGTAQGASTNPGMTPDGAVVVFESGADNLVAMDRNTASDVFVLDRAGSGLPLLVSFNQQGTGSGNAPSGSPQISPDGRFVVFESRASDLVEGDDNQMSDIFVRDVPQRRTYRVTPAPRDLPPGSETFTPFEGSKEPALSGDGRQLAFTQGFRVAGRSIGQVFVHDLVTRSNRLVSGLPGASGSAAWGADYSRSPAVDASGARVAFVSHATNLLPAGDTPASFQGQERPYVWTAASGVTELANRLAGIERPNFFYGTSASQLDAGGRFLAFHSLLSLTTRSGGTVFLYDRETRLARPLESEAQANSGESAPAVMSGDSRWIAFRHSVEGLLLLDTVQSNQIRLARDNGYFEPVFSPGDRFVAFCSADGDEERNLPGGFLNIFLRDLATGVTDWVSRPDGDRLSRTSVTEQTDYSAGALSGDGRFLVLRSTVPAGADGAGKRQELWLHDLRLQTRARFEGTEASAIGVFAYPVPPTISDDGQSILYHRSQISAGTNGNRFLTNDLMLWRPPAGVTKRLARRVTERPVHPLADDGVDFHATMNSNGTVVVYADDTSGTAQLFSLQGDMTSAQLITSNAFNGLAANRASFGHVLSGDGRWLFFFSSASDLVPVGGSSHGWLRDLAAGRTLSLTNPATGDLSHRDIHPCFSGDGRRLAYTSRAGIVLFETANETWDILPLPGLPRFPPGRPTPPHYFPTLSGDGNYLALLYRDFQWAVGSASPPANAYLATLGTNAATLISKQARTGIGGDGNCLSLSVSHDGRYTLYRTRARNLVSNDLNNLCDLYLYDRLADTSILLGMNLDRTGTGDSGSLNPIMSADGGTIVFESFAGNLVADDFNRGKDIFVVRLTAGDTDGDGLPDDWEMAHFGTLARDGRGDFEGDGQTDRQEFLAGTDPANRNSVFRVLTISAMGAGQVQLVWSAVTGRRYRLEYRDEVTDVSWRSLGDVMVATGPAAGVSDPSPVPTGRRFYRVLLVE